jgi:hypothetical protein
MIQLYCTLSDVRCLFDHPVHNNNEYCVVVIFRITFIELVQKFDVCYFNISFIDKDIFSSVNKG